MVFPLSGRSLGVNLLRMPFFKDDKPVCTEAEYLSERGGDKFPYQTKEHVSYEELSPMMDADIRQKFPKKPVFVVILNWLLILVLCYLSWLGLIVWLLVLTMTGNGTQKAAALMARQAYTIERSSRIEEAPPPGKEVDIGAHHIVMMYLEKYMTVTFSYSGGLFSVFKAAKEFSKMRNVQAFCEEAAKEPFAAYGWQHDERFKPAVVNRAVERLSVPVNGPRTLWVAIPLGIWLVGMFIQSLVFFALDWRMALFNLLLSLLIIGLVLYLTVYYLLVTRTAEGVIEPAYDKIKSGLAGDPVAAVSDLAACGAKMSLTVPDATALPASTHYWMSITNPGGTARLAAAPPPGPTAVVVNMPTTTSEAPDHVKQGTSTPRGDPDSAPAGAYEEKK